jgi:hypothetical protein
VTRRGWSNAGLPTVGDDGALWSVADAARLLGPPDLNADQVRNLIRLTNIRPVGIRRIGRHSGRGARVYLAGDLIRAYDALHGVATALEPGDDSGA